MAIRVLPDDVAARIAAGEVIERPASVVKELIENSLDAGATRIDVEVRDGGRSLIRVVDNGRGISADEIELAFERFATSKLDDASDLMRIRTLGFRGEALPSIASVSTVAIASRAAGADRGVLHVRKFGVPVSSDVAGVPPGTSVQVVDLFANVPARLKFMRSAQSEMGRVHQVVAMYALARPDVAFTLTGERSRRIAAPGSGKPLDAAASVYGARVARAMLALRDPDGAEGDSRAFNVQGLVSSPEISRGSRNYVTLCVNGRWFQNRRLSFAVEQAYHGLLGERRFPIALIQITVPPGDVDVNVHPAKTEVRFLREQLVFAKVQQAVRSTLLEHSPVPGLTRIATGSAGGAGPMARRAPGAELPAGVASPLWPEPLAPDAGETAPFQQAGSADAGPTEPAAPATLRRALPVLRVIGQARETYIIAEGPEGVYLIDQHAAHERVLFEEISRRLETGDPESQQLLAPEPVELTPDHEAALASHGDLLAGLGFVFEPFGPHAVVVRAVPRILKKGAGGEALLRLLDGVVEGASHEDWRARAVATLACHASVTAGRTMAMEESRALVRRLERCRQPHTCPHGRPTMVHLSASAMAREFKRR